MSATLRLTRHANGMVIELRRGQFEIELDGKPIGTSPRSAVTVPWSGRAGSCPS